MGRPKKPKIIYHVRVYQDNVTKLWHIFMIPDRYITGFPSESAALQYVKDNEWIIKTD